MAGRPAPGEYSAYFGRYIDLVAEAPLLDVLRAQGEATAAWLSAQDPALGGHRYAPGKWTVNDVIAHVVDTERIFAARALRIGRGDPTPLPGFDQDAYVRGLDLSGQSLAALSGTFARLRASTLDLFGSFSEADLVRLGTVDGAPLSTRAAGWIIAGHEQHHVAIVRERYLS